MQRRRTILSLAIALFLFSACDNSSERPEKAKSVEANNQETLFTLVDEGESGLAFYNELRENEELNILTYEYLYNGSGVAVGDINNDGLPDVFLGGNLFGGRLFLNKGVLKFEQISETAGVFVTGYTTGVSMVDINEDGFLDIYICRSMLADAEGRANVLLINNGDLTFTDRAEEYGLADRSFSNHANFFDYDNDGDLDMYLLNHRTDFKDALTLKTYTNKKGDHVVYQDTSYQFVSDKLYRNNGDGTFSDVTKQAGMVNRAFGLSAAVTDINKDGWMDVYVANDYADKDHFYINQGDGTFKDDISELFFHTSKNAMGSDIADINNDGLVDLVNLDMTPEDNYRQKQLKGPGAYDLYHMAINYGLSHQVMRNTLQLNNGNGTFSEIGQLAGMSHTDWSWTPILADFDNDGFKDLFISNGYYRDVTDMDYLKYESNEIIEAAGGLTKVKSLDLVNKLKSNPVSNYMFKNNGDLTFDNVSTDWGIAHAAISNGAVYADLDQDGDLDIIINNLQTQALLYENHANERSQSHYLALELNGSESNPHGIGAKTYVTAGDVSQYQEATPYRGYFSSHEPLLHFGLGDHSSSVSVHVIWPDGAEQIIEDVSPDQRLVVSRSDASKNVDSSAGDVSPAFMERQPQRFTEYEHQEDDFIDFKREPLLEHALSNKGPFLAQGDVNGDGLADIYMGASKGYPGQLYLQNKDGEYAKSNIPAFNSDAAFEDAQALFFDADSDEDLDLYVVSGGYAEAEDSENYQDRLYVNDGSGSFTRAMDALPMVYENGTCVESMDVDADGDLDLFVGAGAVPGSYPLSAMSQLLINESGVFALANDRIPNGGELGMVNDAALLDVNADGTKDLLVAGEWMPVTPLINQNGRFQEATELSGLLKSSGWWNTMAVADFDADGDLDVVCGNRGENSFYRASAEQPAKMYAKDFDGNRSIDAMPFYYFNDGESHPKHVLDEVFSQYPSIRRKFNRYHAYSNAGLDDIFSPDELEGALELSAETFATTYFENQGNGQFEASKLPSVAQFSEVHGILPFDVNGDGHLDMLLTGNNYQTDVEMGRSDASIGAVLLGNGQGEFRPVPVSESGFSVVGDARGVYKLQGPESTTSVVVLKNQGSPEIFKIAQ